MGQVATEEDKTKTQRVRVHYYELNKEQREQYFRLKSAKKDKKRNEEARRKEEVHEWKTQQHTEKLRHAMQKKKMQDMQEEALR